MNFNLEMLRNGDPNDPAYRRVVSQVNQAWQEQLNSPGGEKKVAAFHESQLDSYYREHAVMTQILQPTDVSDENTEVSAEGEHLYVRLYFTPETRAYLGSFGSGPMDTQEVFIDRIFVSFMMFTTNVWRMNEYRISTYPFDVVTQVEESLGMDLHEMRDFVELKSLEETIQASRATHDNVLIGAEVDKSGGAPFEGGRVSMAPDDMTNIKKYFAGRRDKGVLSLLTEVDYLDLERLDAGILGDQLAGEVIQNGWNLNQIRGHKFIRTIKCDTSKGDIFKPGNIYSFSDPKSIGRSYNMHGIKLNVKRERQFVEMDARMATGHLWAVARRVCKTELYRGGQTVAGANITGSNAGTGVTAYDALWGPSDQLWQDPELVLERDIYHVADQFHRPLVTFQ